MKEWTRRALLGYAGAAFCAELPKNRLARPADVEEARIPSTLDGEPQPAWFLPGRSGSRAPLLVYLHSWSATYNNTSGLAEALAECRTRGWSMISPDFRGPNDRPEACASRLAIQDVLDAAAFARARTAADGRRIFVLGGSGGGHMALTMAHAAPQFWAAVSAWVPIADLAAWHRFSKRQGSRYYAMIERCCGGPPGSPRTDDEYRARSPLFHLHKARGLAVDIQTGIHDGHTGSVPVSQSARAFNALAEANSVPARQLNGSEIEIVTSEERIPEALAGEPVRETRRRPVLFRRAAGPARLTIFDGGHETDVPAAMIWLERQKKS